MNRFTQIVLLVLALGLWANVLTPFLRPEKVGAAMGDAYTAARDAESAANDAEEAANGAKSAAEDTLEEVQKLRCGHKELGYGTSWKVDTESQYNSVCTSLPEIFAHH